MDTTKTNEQYVPYRSGAATTEKRDREWREPWSNERTGETYGFIRWALKPGARKPTPTYYIRRMINGRRYVVSTRAHSLDVALKHLARFEADPEGYRPEGEVRAAPLYLDNDLIVAFLRWSKEEKKNSKRWIHDQYVYLRWWRDRLTRVDLRKVSLAHLVDALENAPAKAQRTAVIKVLLTYLRKKGRITAAQDPTLFGALPVPKAKVAQHKKTKVVPVEHVDLVIEHLAGHVWRDALIVQAGTGWHTTEVLRFAEGGSIEPLPLRAVKDGSAGVIVCPKRKSGETQRTRVTADVLEAAKRLLGHGSFSREHYDRSVRQACRAVKRPDGKTGIPVFTPAMLRHTIATMNVNAGTPMSEVSEYLGHKSLDTTRRYYATLAVTKKVETLR